MVTQNAVIERINRKLPDGQVLRSSRVDELGYYYIADTNLNTVVAYHVDPERLAWELGVPAEEETVSE